MESLSDFYYKNGYGEPQYGITDKGSTHDYINGYYNSEFSYRREETLKILEIGVSSGSSISLWNKFFGNSLIYGVDVQNGITDVYKPIMIEKNIKLIFDDAYNDSVVNLFPNDYFDYIIDDGPHTLQSQMDCINKWLCKVKSGGKIIIEDIQQESDALSLRDAANLTSLVKTSTIIDLRLNKGRWDDLILEVVKK